MKTFRDFWLSQQEADTSPHTCIASSLYRRARISGGGPRLFPESFRQNSSKSDKTYTYHCLGTIKWRGQLIALFLLVIRHPMVGTYKYMMWDGKRIDGRSQWDGHQDQYLH